MRAPDHLPGGSRYVQRRITGILSLLVLFAFSARPVVARTGQNPATAPVLQLGILDGLGDIIVGALTELLRVLFSPIEGVIENYGDDILGIVVQTPHPDAVFSSPSNGPWPTIYTYYWDSIVPLALGLYGLSIGLVILLESTSHLFSNYHRTKLNKRAFSGLLGILSWWWIAALSLRFIDALGLFLVPSLSDVSLFETLSFTGMGVIGLVIALMADLTLFILIGLVYLVRHLVLYLFVLMMPILIVLWIPGVGPFTLASRFMKKLAGFYVPFLFMSIPVALLFRVGELLGQSAGFSGSGIVAWLTALVVPFAAVVSPFVLFWQAGLILFMADRAAQHVSAQRARRRVNSGSQRVRRAGRGGRNFVRGVRDEPPVRSDGQAMLGSGSSRAHAAGQRVNNAGSRLGSAFSTRNGGNRGGSGGNGQSGGGGSAPSDDGGPSGGDSSGSERSQGRNASHDNLRDGGRSRRNGPRVDDEPRYVQ